MSLAILQRWEFTFAISNYLLQKQNIPLQDMIADDDIITSNNNLI